MANARWTTPRLPAPGIRARGPASYRARSWCCPPPEPDHFRIKKFRPQEIADLQHGMTPASRANRLLALSCGGLRHDNTPPSMVGNLDSRRGGADARKVRLWKWLQSYIINQS